MGVTVAVVFVLAGMLDRASPETMRNNFPVSSFEARVLLFSPSDPNSLLFAMLLICGDMTENMEGDDDAGVELMGES